MKNLQQGLFKYNWDEVKKNGSSKYQAEVLFNLNLLSFNPAEIRELDYLEFTELVFLKTLFFDSGLPKENILTMLSGLEKPYCYSFNENYWDFQKGEWKDFPVLKEPEIEDLIERLAEEEDFDRLKALKESIELILKANK